MVVGAPYSQDDQFSIPKVFRNKGLLLKETWNLESAVLARENLRQPVIVLQGMCVA